MTEYAAMITAIVLITNGASIETAMEDFARLGFEATTIAGGSLMITGQVTLFASQFQTKLETDAMGGVTVQSDGPASRILPKDKLPASMQNYVLAIEFEEPISFGPTDY